MADLTLDMMKGTIRKDIAELPEKMLDSAYEELLQQAELMKGYAQVNVRVDTGALRDSIRIERVGPTRHLHRMVRVRAGGYKTNPKTGKIVNYAAIVELKYPYMRPAWEAIKPNINALIKRRVVRDCSK